MIDKLVDVELLRNTSLFHAESYESKAIANKEFDVANLEKKAIDSTQLFNMLVAKKLAQKKVELGRTATLGSIHGKIQSRELIKFSEATKYAKAQKKRRLL